jgi:hypothetical protein
MRYARNRINLAEDPSGGSRALSRESGKTRRMPHTFETFAGSSAVSKAA